jgi:hypothetical protein
MHAGLLVLGERALSDQDLEQAVQEGERQDQANA